MSPSTRRARRRSALLLRGVVAVALATLVLAGCGSDAGNLLGGDLIPGTPTTAPPATTAPPPPP